MDSQKVLSEAWQTTLKNKYLWVFGFVAALTFGSEDIGVSLTQGGAWFFQNLDEILSSRGVTALLTITVSIVFWLLGLVARIGLIQNITIGVQSQKLLSKVTELFRSSTQYLGFIVLMQILVWSPIIVMNIIIAVLARPFMESFASSVKTGGMPDFVSFGTAWLLVMSIFLLSIPLMFIDAFSYRSIVIEDLGVVDGIKRAYYVIKANVNPILGLSILCAVIGIAFSFAVGLLAAPLSLAMMPVMLQSLSECAEIGDGRNIEAMQSCVQDFNSQPLFVALSVLIGIISAAISSVWVTFQSSAFTLAYVKLTTDK